MLVNSTQEKSSWMSPIGLNLDATPMSQQGHGWLQAAATFAFSGAEVIIKVPDGNAAKDANSANYANAPCLKARFDTVEDFFSESKVLDTAMQRTQR